MEISKQLVSFNRNIALERVGGDEELLREVAQIYLTEYPPLIEKIRSAVGSGDSDALQRAAHTLKGSLATLGAEPAAALALTLESKGRENTLDSAADDLLHLEEELGRVHREMHALAEGL